MDIFRRSNRSMQSHIPRENARSIPLIHHSSSTSPTQDSEDEKGGTQPRRRIALACSRCRKRKIKCSGDLGHGLGCQNCKNAGSDPGACQFLRVNSTNTYYSPPNPVTWPYTNSTTLAPASGIMRVNSNLAQYSSTGAGLLSSSSSGSFSLSNQLSRVPSLSNASGAPFSAMPSRQNYSPNCENHISDDALDQIPHYLFPGQNSQALAPGYGQNAQQWKPITHHPVTRANSELNQDSALRYGASYSYLNSSTTSSIPSMATDGSPVFPGLGSLEKSLSTHNVNRTLPNPTLNKAFVESVTHGNQGGVPDFPGPFGVPQNLSYKSELSWGNEHVTASGDQCHEGSVSLSNTNNSEADSKPLSSPRLPQDTTGLGLISLSNNSLTLAVSHPADYMPSILPESTSSSDTHIGLGENTFQASLSNEAIISNHGATNLYSYSVSSSGRNGSITDPMASEGTLANGQVYTRLRPTDSQPASSFDPLRKRSLEISASTHRAPISNNSARHR